MFPDRTGLVHISGVEPEGGVDKDTMLDGDRVLIGVSDELDNTGQIAALLRGGYTGAFSFECFAASVHHDVDIAQSLRFSMEFIRDRVRALTL